MFVLLGGGCGLLLTGISKSVVEAALIWETRDRKRRIKIAQFLGTEQEGRNTTKTNMQT